MGAGAVLCWVACWWGCGHAGAGAWLVEGMGSWVALGTGSCLALFLWSTSLGVLVAFLFSPLWSGEMPSSLSAMRLLSLLLFLEVESAAALGLGLAAIVVGSGLSPPCRPGSRPLDPSLSLMCKLPGRWSKIDVVSMLDFEVSTHFTTLLNGL